ncbi:MAG: hypothetical protein OXH65_13030 [Paracoccaceae bacterium]|nr:hypothetical protein [Paracoccaceae bacterium]MCY4101026.1 hypothetical protein [Paracoccaceae bacterium]MDE2676020.1 hypothetical protein [Paracoccaceae bacterium]
MEIKNEKHEVRVKPHDYQPNKAELEEKIHVPTTPEKLAKAVLQQVKVVETNEA